MAAADDAPSGGGIDEDDDMEWEEAEDDADDRQEEQFGDEGEDEEATTEELEAALAAMRQDMEGAEDDDDDDMGGAIVVQLEDPDGDSKPSSSEGKGDGSKKRRGQRTLKELHRDFRLHCAHLNCLTMRARLVMKWCQHPEVRAMALSMVPVNIHNMFEDQQHKAQKQGASIELLRQLAAWFRRAFKQIPDENATDSEGREGSGPDRLVRVLSQRVGCGHELAQVFAAMASILGWSVRLVCPLFPISYFNPPYLNERKKKLMLQEKQQAAANGKGSSSSSSKQDLGGDSSDSDRERKKKRRKKQGGNEGVAAGTGRKTLLLKQRRDGGCGSLVWVEVLVKGEDDRKPAAAPIATNSTNGKSRASSASSSSPSPSEAGKKRPRPSTTPTTPSSAHGGGSSSKQLAEVIELLSSDEDDGPRPPPRLTQPPPPPSSSSSRSTSRWVHVDPVRGLLDQAGAVEGLKRPKGYTGPRRLHFVLAVDDNKHLSVTDVTRRYTNDWSSVSGMRCSRWFTAYIKKVNAAMEQQLYRDLTLRGEHRAFFEAEARREAEVQQLKAMERKQPMPTTIEGFKKHAVYALERHLHKFDVVYPRKVAGLFKGEPVFFRDNVRRGATLRQWKMQGRTVKADEVDKPCRISVPKKDLQAQRKRKKKKQEEEGKKKKGGGKKRRSTQDDSSDDDDEYENDRQQEKGEAAMATGMEVDEEAAEEGGSEGGDKAKKKKPTVLHLYDISQTEAVKRLPLLQPGDRIPVNEHGNVEVWGRNPAFLPQDTVHLDLPRIYKVANDVKIHCAPALTGFELRQGRHVPVVEGIVCRAYDRDVLMDAWAVAEGTRVEKAQEKREAKVIKCWERFTKGLFNRARILNQYGGGGGTGCKKGSAAAGARNGGGAGKQKKKKQGAAARRDDYDDDETDSD